MLSAHIHNQPTDAALRGLNNKQVKAACCQDTNKWLLDMKLTTRSL